MMRKRSLALLHRVPRVVRPAAARSSIHPRPSSRSSSAFDGLLFVRRGERGGAGAGGGAAINTTERLYSTPSITNRNRNRNDCDPIFQLSASNLRFGPGATAEVGQDLREQYGCRRVLVVTDRTVRRLPCFAVLLESLERSRVDCTIFDKVRVEPNAASFQRAIDFFSAPEHANYDGVVAMGGGSVMDTAKAANLYACHPPASNDFYDYVNPPLGKGLPIPHTAALKPLIAIPTTAGTGSETTGVAIFDDTATNSKTGIANRHLRPALGIVDPNNTATLPPDVATYSGLDVLCHAVESYTALPSDRRSPRPQSPLQRPTYQGSNAVADVWSLMALRLVARHLPTAVQAAAAAGSSNGANNANIDGGDESDAFGQARFNMLLASAAAGTGFGSAGVHLCHGMSYPVSSQAPRAYRLPSVGGGGAAAVASGYPQNVDGDDGDNNNNDDDDDDEHALIPHGLSVIVNAPAVFRWTGVADPERHAHCARILREARLAGTSSSSSHLDCNDAGAWLADEIGQLCDALGVRTGLRQFGYNRADHLESLVDGTLPQHRVTGISPRGPVRRGDLEALFAAALEE